MKRERFRHAVRTLVICFAAVASRGYVFAQTSEEPVRAERLPVDPVAGRSEAPPPDSGAPPQWERSPTSGISIPNAKIELIDRAELASTQTGVIAFEVPAAGTRVSEGDVIARLDDTVPAAALAVAQAQASTDAEIRSAERVAEVARSEVASADEANSAYPNTVSKLDYNRLKLTAARSEYDVDVAKRDLAVAKARVHEAEMLLHTYEITAPFSGVVRRRFRRNGEAIRQGDPVVELASTARVRVIARIPIEELGRFTLGQAVRVATEYPFRGEQRTLSGDVTFIDLFDGDVNLKRVDVHIEVDNPDGVLIPGLQATVLAD